MKWFGRCYASLLFLSLGVVASPAEAQQDDTPSSSPTAQPAAQPAPPAQDDQVSLPLRNARNREKTGRWLIDPKIMGGRNAKPGDDPWQVMLLDGKSADPRRVPFCGGSLIADRWVLTAAHCLDGSTGIGDVHVLGGIVDYRSGGSREKVRRILLHPDYRPDPLWHNDIALIELAAPLTGRVAAIQLDDGRWAPPGQLVRVTGWGATSESGGWSSYLQTVDVSVIPHDICRDPVSHGARILPSMLCAGFKKGKKDSCKGDSGGPLSFGTDIARHVAGVVSWSTGCGRPDKFGVYTRVSSFRPWIDACLAGRAECTQRSNTINSGEIR